MSTVNVVGSSLQVDSAQVEWLGWRPPGILSAFVEWIESSLTVACH